MRCFDCKRKMDLYDEPAMCFLVGDKMEYTCKGCSDIREEK